MSSFDLRRLRYFVSVAELGSVTRAAATLHVAQPALSYQIRQLEEELGVQLFARGSHGVALTEAGRRLAHDSRQLMQQISEVRIRCVEFERADPEGEVVVGVAQTISLALAPALIESVVAELPRVRLQIREVMSSDTPAMIRSGALDFALSYSISPGYGVASTLILSEELLLFGSAETAKNLLATDRRVIEFDSLAGLPLYLSAKSNASRDQLERFAKERGIQLNVVAEVDSVALRKEAALRSRAFTIVSGAALQRELGQPGTFAATIDAPEFQRKVCFVKPSGATLSRAAQQVALLAARCLSQSVANKTWQGVLYPRELEAAVSEGS
jgi:LysR family transcriptional regulator, nitrogen assimilation regulatory protein